MNSCMPFQWNRVCHGFSLYCSSWLLDQRSAAKFDYPSSTHDVFVFLCFSLFVFHGHIFFIFIYILLLFSLITFNSTNKPYECGSGFVPILQNKPLLLSWLKPIVWGRTEIVQFFLPFFVFVLLPAPHTVPSDGWAKISLGDQSELIGPFQLPGPPIALDQRFLTRPAVLW